MITVLKSRSLVEYIYVTVSCNAKTPINRRDLKKNMIIDFIKRLAKMSKVCLMVIDSAGLNTNMSDLESFICEHRNIEKIIIDTLAHDNQVHIVECAEEIVKLKSLLSLQDCRILFIS
ncbi:hypothetical protein BD770DRAFT_212398 [Pilaira anomala]|nr:hypothetical protein BD770DRAFT_212398 [Pilaira anomala]